MSCLYRLILSSQEGDRISQEILISKFQPLLKKYTYMLNYEDAYNDLLLALINLIKTIRLHEMKSHEDAPLLIYIKQSIYHTYIALSKEYRKLIKSMPISLPNICDDENNYISKWDKLVFAEDEHLKMEYEFLYQILTKYEAEIIIYFFFMKYTVKEIAAMYSVSLPAITQAKKNAIRKLRQKYVSDDLL